jgi:Fur family peroxide stress response transcriptional regulator
MDPLVEFAERCRARGLAVTHQRMVIYRELVTMPDHPSPEAIYEKVKAEIPAISLGTVYKNLHTFVEAGLIQEVSLHHGALRLDPNTHPHHHFVCTTCRRIVDLEEAGLEPVRLRQPLPAGFAVQRISVELHGLCPQCAPAGS